MTRNLVTLSPNMNIMEAVSILCEKHIAGAPVLDQLGNFVGILVEKDCLNAVLDAAYHEQQTGRVENFMHRNVDVVEDQDNITDVANRLIKSGHRGMPVISNNNLVGMINRSDILKAIIKYI
ncbi:MAG: CBS domain-containing protein [Gammaproteobacteria bacterium]